MKILITNDDGITSDGIVRLAEMAKNFGEVYVVAPESERSAMSHSISLRKDFDAWKVDFPVDGVSAFACSGTPADCIRIGVLNTVPGKPDIVFSGINFGYNAASDLQYSATVGAAFEASFQGIQAIAFSEDSNGCHEVTDRYLLEIAKELVEKPLGENTIWNVNFPGCKLEECKGILRERTVSTGVFFRDIYHEKEKPDGRITYSVEGIREYEGDEGTDLHALLNDYVSIGIVGNLR